ncbi:aminomethyl-transferring glycine dehydrogenase subunit GcvPB [Candidatus Bathyarchaeota archaeon]|nr:aminomethyl-transferring glycine dehydrogenase subunit GcvPB [Candidatus Bathyarchaeota archaeon]MBS7631087.1 aminomethyl-transferring glycine dehydrogenase subunit GcvPB [Candidatus Bathyarchaeota archaeon]
MRKFRQADWDEPLIFELSREGRVGFFTPSIEPGVRDPIGEVEDHIPANMIRESLPKLPELSEIEVLRHYLHLSQMNYGVNSGLIYPLGSCTMKYNPIINEVIASYPKITEIHPDQDESTVQGILEIMYQLKDWLLTLTGMDDGSFEPAAGAHGEYLGNLLIRAYFKEIGEIEKRSEIIIPDSAHGTNPASAAMAGFKVVEIPSKEDGCLDLEALKSVVGDHTAGLMLTNPNTLGIFESEISRITEIVHKAGGLTYYDGANMNAILGKCRPGDMGFDIVHLNLHKTFSTPHGGGGPGACFVGVKSFLSDFLPVPIIEEKDGEYRLNYDKPKAIGKIKGYYGNISPILKAYAYTLSLGGSGLKESSEIAVLNSNYVATKLKNIRGLSLPCSPDKPRKHEAVLSAKKMMDETGVRALNISKKLLDFGIHAPTVYFPLIVPEALMIEPTESESLERLEELIFAFKTISDLAYSKPDEVLDAPKNTSVNRLDEVRASHPKTMCLSWRNYCTISKQQT